MRLAFPTSEEVKTVLQKAITSLLHQIYFSIGIPSSELYTQWCQMSAIRLINNNHLTHSKLTRIGKCICDAVPSLGKQATKLARKLGQLVLLW